MPAPPPKNVNKFDESLSKDFVKGNPCKDPPGFISVLCENFNLLSEFKLKLNDEKTEVGGRDDLASETDVLANSGGKLNRNDVDCVVSTELLEIGLDNGLGFGVEVNDKAGVLLATEVVDDESTCI